MWTTILKIIASIAAYLSNKQLLDAGEAIQRDKINEMDNQARAEAKKTKADIANLSDADLDERLRKWKR